LKYSQKAEVAPHARRWSRPWRIWMIILYLFGAVLLKVTTRAHWRATARTEVTFLDRADSPGATNRFLRQRAPEPNKRPGETAATDAQWGDRALERQYRDRMGLRWLASLHAQSTGRPCNGRRPKQSLNTRLSESARPRPRPRPSFGRRRIALPRLHHAG
jgi:hypothetical protein